MTMHAVLQKLAPEAGDVLAATDELIRLESSSVSTGAASQTPAAMKWCNY
jgi:hypothetical protein